MTTPDAFRSMLPAEQATLLARKCAWCRSWFSDADRLAHERGCLTSHGICAACFVKVEAEIQTLDSVAS